MNIQEYALVCLIEECSEVIQAATKTLRFGPSECYPETGVSNEDQLSAELDDLRGTIAFAGAVGIGKLPRLGAIEAKVAKIGESAKRSKALGVLEHEEH